MQGMLLCADGAFADERWTLATTTTSVFGYGFESDPPFSLQSSFSLLQCMSNVNVNI
jgi:hypothetical protein